MPCPGLLICIGYDLFTIVSVPFGFVANIADTWYGVFIINFLVKTPPSAMVSSAMVIRNAIMPSRAPLSGARFSYPGHCASGVPLPGRCMGCFLRQDQRPVHAGQPLHLSRRRRQSTQRTPPAASSTVARMRAASTSAKNGSTLLMGMFDRTRCHQPFRPARNPVSFPENLHSLTKGI